MIQPEDKTIDTLAISYSGFEDSGLDQAAEHANNDELPYSCSPNQLCENPEEQTLQALVCRLVSQDQVAFAALFKVMATRIHSLALRITGDAQLSEEVTEDTFFQIWRQAPRFDPARGTAKAWMLTIARSRALDARRNFQRYEKQEVPETEADNAGQCGSDLSELLMSVEQSQLLHNALQNLESLPRQLIALSFFKGLSHEEIAEYAKLPLGTVKSHLRRAVIRLRETLVTTTQPQ